ALGGTVVRLHRMPDFHSAKIRRRAMARMRRVLSKTQKDIGLAIQLGDRIDEFDLVRIDPAVAHLLPGAASPADDAPPTAQEKNRFELANEFENVAVPNVRQIL